MAVIDVQNAAAVPAPVARTRRGQLDRVVVYASGGLLAVVVLAALLAPVLPLTDPNATRQQTS